MREKGIDREQAMDSVRLQRLIDVCDTKENTALYLLQEWNYEPQVDKKGNCFRTNLYGPCFFLSPPPAHSLSPHLFQVVSFSLRSLDGIWLRAF